MSETFGLVGAVALVYVGPVVAAVVAARLATARQRRARRWALENGWHAGEADAALTTLVVALLGGARNGRHRRLAHDVLTGGSVGARAYSFTYRWQSADDDLRHVLPTGGRRMRSAHVVAVPLDRIVRMVQVTPEGAMSSLATAVGAQDLQLESSAFNRAYRVVADDPRVAHAVLHPRLMERLLTPEALGTSWRIEHGWVFAWVDGRTDVERILPLLDVVTAVRASLPSFVGTPPAPARPLP